VAIPDFPPSQSCGGLSNNLKVFCYQSRSMI
jgi:hypothetical protein